MVRRKRQPPLSTGRILRALILFFPLGLYYIWKRQCRWSIEGKLLATTITVLVCIGFFMGTLSVMPTQEAIRAQADATQKRWQSGYALFADDTGVCYHVEGCVHLTEGATSIELYNAFKAGMVPDPKCNPPRFDARN